MCVCDTCVSACIYIHIKESGSGWFDVYRIYVLPFLRTPLSQPPLSSTKRSFVLFCAESKWMKTPMLVLASLQRTLKPQTFSSIVSRSGSWSFRSSSIVNCRIEWTTFSLQKRSVSGPIGTTLRMSSKHRICLRTVLIFVKNRWLKHDNRVKHNGSLNSLIFLSSEFERAKHKTEANEKDLVSNWSWNLAFVHFWHGRLEQLFPTVGRRFRCLKYC